MKEKRFEIDMTTGSILSKILIFSIPLMLSGILQLLFNAADMIVIGKYSTKSALAAIGATSSLINFFVNLIIGISIGANVVVARYIGAKKSKEIHDAVHTAILVGALLGVIVGFIGFFACKPMLSLMKTPDDVIDYAVLYVAIYFIGLPGTMIYNFGSAVLRAIGDTRRPLIILTISGIINVALNLLFVIKFGMSVDGVALATIISQAFSAVMVIIFLMKSNGDYKLKLRDLAINKPILIKILRVGLPAGFQSMIFSISNMLIQSSINLFGKTAMAGSTTAANIEGFVYTAMNAVYQTTISFVSQNYGAGKFERIKPIALKCILVVFITGLLLGNIAYYFGHFFLSLYSEEEDVIEYGLIRMKVIMTTYFTCGLMEVCCGVLRGLGYGILPMIVSLIGACGFRIVWIYTIFQKYHTLENLYLSYPITWLITVCAHLVCISIVSKRIKKRTAPT